MGDPAAFLHSPALFRSAAAAATLAAAAVDADLRARASAAGLALPSSRAEAKPDDPGGGPSGPGVRIEDQAVVEGKNEALQALLIALETGLPTVLVDDLAIEPATVDGPAGGIGALGDDPQAPRLHVSLTLSAYWRPGEAPHR